MVLARLPALQLGALAVDAEAAAVQVRGQAAGALGDLAVGQAAVAPHDALPVGQGLDEHVEGLGQVELDGRLRAVWGTAPHCTGGLRSPTAPTVGGSGCGGPARHRQRSRGGRPQPRHRRGHHEGRGADRGGDRRRHRAGRRRLRALAGRGARGPGPPAAPLRRRRRRAPRGAGRARGGQRRPRHRQRALGGGQRARRARVLRRRPRAPQRQADPGARRPRRHLPRAAGRRRASSCRGTSPWPSPAGASPPRWPPATPSSSSRPS